MFERKIMTAPAYIAPVPLTLGQEFCIIPRRAAAVLRTLRRRRNRHLLQFVAEKTDYSVSKAVNQLQRARAAKSALAAVSTLSAPPENRFVLFGLHMQPESSIDVWAPFFSNQSWVIELLSRSIPPTHKLLVKIHKSDATRYPREHLDRIAALPGVQIVHPFADARSFIACADLVVAIQGTMGLEAALLGKPVVMLGESPVTCLPSAVRIGELDDLPGLLRRKLGEAPPDRNDILSGFAEYLAPFRPASHNDWTVPQTDEQIGAYVDLLGTLKRYVLSHFGERMQSVK